MQIGCSRRRGDRDLGDRPRGTGVDRCRRRVHSSRLDPVASTAGLSAARRVPARRSPRAARLCVGLLVMGSEDRGDRDQQVPERCDAWREDRQRGHAGVEADIGRDARRSASISCSVTSGLEVACACRGRPQGGEQERDHQQRSAVEDHAARSACLGSPQPSACSETAERHRHQQGEITRALAKRNRRKTVGWTSQMPPIVRKLVT